MKKNCSNLERLEDQLQFTIDCMALDEEIWRTLKNGTHVKLDESGEVIEGPKWYKDLKNREKRSSQNTKPPKKLKNSPQESNGKSLEKAKEKFALKCMPKDFHPLERNRVIQTLRNEAKEWLKKLTPPEYQSIRKYTYNSNDQKKPNRFFERLNRASRNNDETDKTLNRHSEIISQALCKSELKHDTICYRAVDVDPIPKTEVGEFACLRQFISTSATKDKVLKKPFEVVIYARKGSKGAYIEQISSYKSQHEILFDKSCVYKVLCKENNHIELEVYQNE